MKYEVGTTSIDIYCASDGRIVLSLCAPIPNGLFHAGLEYESFTMPDDPEAIGELLVRAITRAKEVPMGSMQLAASNGRLDEQNVAKRLGYRSYKKMASDVLSVSMFTQPDGTTIFTPTVHRDGTYWVFDRYKNDLTFAEPSAVTLGTGLLHALELARDEQPRHDTLTS